MDDRAWPLEPGDKIGRYEFQVEQDWGGRPQGGIAPSRKTSNVFIFMKTTAEEEFGYADGWHTDGCLHYTGEGQVGDQTMAGVNNSLAQHKSTGRALRVFDGSGGTVTYVGEFEVDDDQAWYRTDAPDVNRDIRQVIVFRLRPIEVYPDQRPDHGIDAPLVKVAPLENHQADGYLQTPNTEPVEAVKREAALLAGFDGHLRALGDETSSHYYKPATEPRYLRNDLFNETRRHLIEVKGRVTREAVRTLIGQISDYMRFEDGTSVRTAALLPERPRPDLEDLLSTAGIAVIWPDAEGYADNAGGAFT